MRRRTSAPPSRRSTCCTIATVRPLRRRRAVSCAVRSGRWQEAQPPHHALLVSTCCVGLPCFFVGSVVRGGSEPPFLLLADFEERDRPPGRPPRLGTLLAPNAQRDRRTPTCTTTPGAALPYLYPRHRWTHTHAYPHTQMCRTCLRMRTRVESLHRTSVHTHYDRVQ